MTILHAGRIDIRKVKRDYTRVLLGTTIRLIKETENEYR